MKKLPGVLALLVVAAVITATSAGATGGPPGGGFYSGQTIQNIGTADALVQVVVYDATSTATYTLDRTVVKGSSTTFLTSDIPNLPAGFQGSGVVSSDQPIKAIVNVTNRQNGTNGIAGGTAAAQYRGVDSASTGTTLAFPLAKSNFNGKTSAFYIQNAGQTAATFTATFKMGINLSDTNPVSSNYTSPSLAPGQMAAIIAADAGVAAQRIGSLTVTSAQPMAGVVLEYETATSPAKILQGTNGFTPNDFDTRILFPVVKKQLGGRSTGLQIQNTTGGTITVNVTYHGANSACPNANYASPQNPKTLTAGQSTTYLDEAVLPAGCLASAEATGTGNIAGVVNESFQPCTGTCTQRATMYSAFPAKSATTKLVAPVFKQNLGGKISGLSVQNVSGTDTTATVVFQVGATAYTYNNLAIKAGASALLNNMQNTTAYPTANWGAGGVLPNSSLAAVTITAGQGIIAIVNEAPTGTVVQDNINYEAFNVAP